MNLLRILLSSAILCWVLSSPPAFAAEGFTVGDATSLLPLGFTKVFISADQNVPTVSGTTTIAHNLGSVPFWGFIYLRCITAELGYAIGDRVNVTGVYSASTLTLAFDATNVYIVNNGVSVPIQHRTTGANTNVTPANWKLVAEAWG